MSIPLRRFRKCGIILAGQTTLIIARLNLGYQRQFISTSSYIYQTGSGSPSSSSSDFNSLYNKAVLSRKNAKFGADKRMGYFTIGVSGATCGGKTTLTKLLLRKFPWARVIHQDHYFYDDDYVNHIRVPEAEDHVNYEIYDALDMEKMYRDVQAMTDATPTFAKPQPVTNSSSGVGDKAETPNFDDTFLLQIPDIDFDVSKYNQMPILLIEGFTIYESEYLFNKCDVRLFCALDEETCRQRRSLRAYFPPDTPNYFDKVIWPEYEKHFENFVNKRSGVTVFDANTLMVDIWKASVQIITCRMEEKMENDSTQTTLQ